MKIGKAGVPTDFENSGFNESAFKLFIPFYSLWCALFNASKLPFYLWYRFLTNKREFSCESSSLSDTKINKCWVGQRDELAN